MGGGSLAELLGLGARHEILNKEQIEGTQISSQGLIPRRIRVGLSRVGCRGP